MSIPKRNAESGPLASERTFFVTSSTAQKRFLLQSDRMAKLLLETIRAYRDKEEFQLHAAVVMPDHFHALLTLPLESTIERVMQLIKGGFSFRAKREFGLKCEIWQRGFSEERVTMPEHA